MSQMGVMSVGSRRQALRNGLWRSAIGDHRSGGVFAGNELDKTLGFPLAHEIGHGDDQVAHLRMFGLDVRR